VTGDRRTLSSVTNAARLLKQFTSNERELGVTELARRLGLAKSTVHRLLTTLEQERLIERDPDTARYRLGLAVFELGAAASSPTDLHQAVLLPMSVLRVRTGETVQMAVLDGREVVYIERLESPNTLRLFLQVGQRNHAHCTGTGKCLLAFLDERELEAILDGWHLPAKTAATIIDLDELRRELRRIRSQGYAVNAHESEPGVVSVAGPIRDRTGRVVAAISVAGPAPRMDPRMADLTRLVLEAAATASKRLTWSYAFDGPGAGRPPVRGSSMRNSANPAATG
jgi:IclR family transcriptional regulator, KDG regulon repressor